MIAWCIDSMVKNSSPMIEIVGQHEMFERSLKPRLKFLSPSLPKKELGELFQLFLEIIIINVWLINAVNENSLTDSRWSGKLSDLVMGQ